MDRRELAALGHHVSRIDRRHLGRDRPVDDADDLAQRGMEFLAFLGDEARIRGHAVEQPERGGLADLVDVRGVDEELHGS
jgi:hypothetical protein